MTTTAGIYGGFQCNNGTCTGKFPSLPILQLSINSYTPMCARHWQLQGLSPPQDDLEVGLLGGCARARSACRN